MSEVTRHRLDAGFALLIRVASLLVLLAIVGVVAQMVMVARPLFSGTTLQPTDVRLRSQSTQRPVWVPENLVLWQAQERVNRRIWVGIDQGGTLRGARGFRVAGSDDARQDAWSERPLILSKISVPVSHFLFDPSWRWLLAVGEAGGGSLLSIEDPERAPSWINLGDIDDLEPMPGGRSFLTWEGSVLTQWQWLPGSVGQAPSVEPLRRRTFTRPILEVAAAPGQRVAVSTTAPALHIWHSTSDRVLTSIEVDQAIDFLAWSGNVGIEIGLGDTVRYFDIDPSAGAAALSTLMQPVSYEGYAEPGHRWLPVISQDAEPKFGLLPLIWGTLKAAVIAALVAIPLGVGAAIFVGFFMSPRLRDRAKPMLELLGAFPSVVLGALAALIVAPRFLDWLPGVVGAVLAVPAGILLASVVWRVSSATSAGRRSIEWLPILLMPMVLLFAALGFLAGDSLDGQLPGGSMIAWLELEFGIGAVHRNALLVGLAMGIAVVPMVFSLAEDAIHAVPPTLAAGSLALGSTHWQSYRDVALPVAAPGIIAASMIGFGRAVGETMIVLLVASNTPLMEVNLLEGLRTVSATLALELTEAPFESVHYRVLFAAGLALFTLTFALNSLAEIVRLRAGRRYMEPM